MAERRMFAKSIIDSDAFIDMPVTARLLYYDLAMRADDDGFVNSPKKIMRMIGVSTDDMNVLLMRKFVIAFDNGVVVIKHWRIHNYIRKDTYNKTNYIDQMAMLEIDENNAYTMRKPQLSEGSDSSVNEPSTSRPRNVDEPSTQVRLGKDSIVKDSTGKDSLVKVSSGESGRSAPPTLSEVEEFARSEGIECNVKDFYLFYSAPDDTGKAWTDTKGNSVINCWKKKLVTWANLEKSNITTSRSKGEKKAKTRNTIDNYKVEGTNHPQLEDIAFNLDDFGGEI